jgi:parallel beta-helix repeat protein
VSPNGNDAASGSASSPWRTLQKAANTARAGDVVLVADGTYAGFQVTADGTASARIVFRATGSAALVNSPNSKTPDHINLEGANYVTVEGFVVRGAPRVGIRAVTATGIVIRGNTVSDCGLTGILTAYTPRILIEDNAVSGSLDEHGIYVSNSTVADDAPVIRGNECFDNNKNGIQLNGDCDAGGDGVIANALIEHNVVHHNNWKGFSLISLQTSTIRNNVIYENGQSAGAGGIHLADQPGCGKPSNDNMVINNTLHEPRITGIRMSNGSTRNVIFNNLVVSSKPIVDEGSGNYIDAASNLKLASDAGVFTGSPAGDYHIHPASPAVDAGVTGYRGAEAPQTDIEGVPRPQGQNCDAGAYEHGLPTGVAGTRSPEPVLMQNAPNPFGSSTRISFVVPPGESGPVTVDIYDVRGRHVRQLVDADGLSGASATEWNGRDDHGRRVATGIYIYRLSVGSHAVTRRMTLVR